MIKRNRPELANEIPESYRKLIEFCWSHDPDERPKFDTIVNILKKDPGFITFDVDQKAYYKYIKQIDQNTVKRHHHHKHKQSKTHNDNQH